MLVATGDALMDATSTDHDKPVTSVNRRYDQNYRSVRCGQSSSRRPRYADHSAESMQQLSGLGCLRGMGLPVQPTVEAVLPVTAPVTEPDTTQVSRYRPAMGLLVIVCRISVAI